MLTIVETVLPAVVVHRWKVARRSAVINMSACRESAARDSRTMMPALVHGSTSSTLEIRTAMSRSPDICW